MKGTYRKHWLPYSSESHCKRFDGTGSPDYGIETQQLDRSVANPGHQKLPESGHRFLHVSVLADMFTSWIQHQNLFLFLLLTPNNNKDR